MVSALLITACYLLLCVSISITSTQLENQKRTHEEFSMKQFAEVSVSILFGFSSKSNGKAFLFKLGIRIAVFGHETLAARRRRSYFWSYQNRRKQWHTMMIK